MKIFLSGILLIIYSIQLLGQGLILDDESYMKIPKTPEQNLGKKDLEEMPFQKDLSFAAPTPPNQGSYKSCVAMATAINAYSIQRAIEKGFQGSSEEINNRFALSAWFPYKSLAPDCKKEMKIDTIAKFIQVNGNLPLQEYQVSNQCDVKISNEEKSKARQKQFIKAIQRVFDVGEKADKKKSSIRLRISQNIPVIVGMYIRENLKRYRQIDDYYDPKKATDQDKEGHAVVVVGYDDDKNAFKIMNSWGKEWGHEGFFWMKYDDFAKDANQAITLVLHDEEVSYNANNNYQLGGTFGFQVLTQSSDGLKRDVVTPIHSKNGLYQLQKKDWTLNQRFQLIAKNEKKGEYFTVFSVNQRHKVSIHYPKDEYGSEVFPIAQFETIIPSITSALNIKEVGKDYLCILYSQYSLRDDMKTIKERIEKSEKADITEIIRDALGKRLVSSEINYEANEMKFSVKLTDDGDTVPMILEVESVEK
jgi:Papain family cysteine protease